MGRLIQIYKFFKEKNINLVAIFFPKLKTKQNRMKEAE